MERLQKRLKATSALTPALLLAFTVYAAANPLDGKVVSGDATITAPDPQTLSVNQTTDRAIIDWREFNIEAGETTRFVQPGSESWILNRVTGSNDPSRILGNLEANGNVIIVNPDGIHFGAGAQVDVNRLIATTSGISNENFNTGNLIFDQAGNASASIVIEAGISIKDYGLAAFVAPSVRNSGTITARLGTINLASGNTFTIDPYGDGLVKLAIDDEISSQVFDVATGQPVTDLVKNEGKLKADGGTVAMSAATARRAVNSVINNTGVIEANTVGMRGGKIILGAQTLSTKVAGAPQQVVRLSGALSATTDAPITKVVLPKRRPEEKGQIVVNGEVILGTSATIDASGNYGGGAVLLGGDYLGGNATPETMARYGIAYSSFLVSTADLVVLDESVTIKADATENGDGGKVVVWSDEATITAADIYARGGLTSGDGGFIETSGGYLDVQNAADASANNGKIGTWLIDPYNITIGSSNSGTQGTGSTTLPIDDAFFRNYIGTGSFGAVFFIPFSSGSVLDDSVIELALNTGTSVLVSTVGAPGSGNGDITLAASINKTSGGEAMLTLDAAGDIDADSGVDIISSSGKLWVAFQALEGSISANNFGELDLNGGALALIAEDDIEMSSNFDMPDLAVVVNPEGNSIGTRSVDIRFDDDDIEFDFTNETAVFRSGAINLVDSSADKSVFIDLGGLDLTLFDGAIVQDQNNSWKVSARSAGVDYSDALNGVAEIKDNGGSTYWDEGNEPLTGTFAVIEVSDNGGSSVTDYLVTAPSGHAILDAYLNPHVPSVVLDPDFDLQELIYGLSDPNAGSCQIGDAACSATDIDVVNLNQNSLDNGMYLTQYNFKLFDQTDYTDANLYSDKTWATFIDNEGEAKRWNYTCLSTVYAMIEYARGNDYRIGQEGTWDGDEGALPIDGTSIANTVERDRQLIQSELANGNPVILRGVSDRFPPPGQHFVLAIGIDQTGKITALDPYGGKRIVIDSNNWTSSDSTAGPFRVEDMRTVEM